MLWDMDRAPDWPPPPFLQHAFLENPWPMLTLLVCAAVIFLLIARHRGKRGPGIAGVALLVAAALFLIMERVVVTDHERIIDSTHRLVRSAALPLDVETFAGLLSRDIDFHGRDRFEMVTTLQRSATMWGVENAIITRLLARTTGPGAGEVYLVVVTRHSAATGGGLSKSSWVLGWREESEGVWRVTQVEWLTLNDEPAQPGMLP